MPDGTLLYMVMVSKACYRLLVKSIHETQPCITVKGAVYSDIKPRPLRCVHGPLLHYDLL